MSGLTIKQLRGPGLASVEQVRRAMPRRLQQWAGQLSNILEAKKRGQSARAEILGSDPAGVTVTDGLHRETTQEDPVTKKSETILNAAQRELVWPEASSESEAIEQQERPEQASEAYSRQEPGTG